MSDSQMHCAMTGIPVTGAGDAIWDEGEWISWEFINLQLEEPDQLESEDSCKESDRRLLFGRLLATAKDYYDITGRHLQIFGELGEMYAETEYGLKRNRPGAPGADGRIGNEHVEVKTIGPTKTKQSVSVKRAGNWSRLIVVKISEDYSIQARILRRSDLKRGATGQAKVSWGSMQEID